MPTALITGPTAGIGNAFAKAYARRGFDLVLVSRDKARLQGVADSLSREYAVRTEVLPADLADHGDLDRVVARLEDADRPIDALVNNAGFGLGRRLSVTTADEEERSLDVLVRAPLRLSQAAIKQMEGRRNGEIINVSSVSGFMPRGTYGAHKAWLTSLTGWMSLAYRDKGVRVTALCPGYVRTEFHQRGNIDITRIPGWMWLDADEVVEQALRDLRAGKAISVPTRRYQIMSTVARLAPRSVAARIARIGR